MNIKKSAHGQWILKLEENELLCLYSHINQFTECPDECPYKPSHHFVTPKCQIANPDKRPCIYIVWQIGEMLDGAKDKG